MFSTSCLFKNNNDDLDDLKNTITQCLIDTMQSVNSSPRDHNHGVWYYDDYANYCAKTNVEFNPCFKVGYANSTYWKRIGFKSFELKSGQKPSEAIKDFINGFTVADCGNVIIACCYAALLKVFGDEKFNLLFASNCASLIINRKTINESIPCLFDWISNEQIKTNTIGHRSINTGEFCYIEGVEFYNNKHPAGCVIGYNLICVSKNEKGEDLFLGFGPETFKKPLTEKELFDVFIYYYNLDRNQFDEKTAQENDGELKSFYPEKIAFDGYITIKGFNPHSTVRLNYKAINEYISIPTSKIFDHHCNAMVEYYRNGKYEPDQNKISVSAISMFPAIKETKGINVNDLSAGFTRLPTI